MSSIDDTESWKDRKFDEVFDEVSRDLEYRKANTPGFSFEDVEAALNDRYLSHGHGWDGGSPVQEIVLAAEIAAYEAKIAEWRGKLQPLKRK